MVALPKGKHYYIVSIVTISSLLLQSKGGILSKACEYIKELRQSNLKLSDDIGALDRLRIDNQLLRQEVCLHVFSQYLYTKAVKCQYFFCHCTRFELLTI